MPDFNESLKAASLAVLRRELSEEERSEFLELAAALGMNSVEDYLYILMIFKRQSDVLGQRFDEISELERKIHDTLERSVDRILGEGARAIASDMGEEIADHARNAFTEGASYYRLKGQIIVACLFWPTMALSYLLGQYGALDWLPSTSFLRAFMSIPAGWCLFLCSAIYTFLWVGDYWYDIRRKLLFKVLLGLQIFAELLLALMMV